MGYKIAIMSTGAVGAYAGADMAPCAFTAGISTSGSGQMQPLPMNELVKEQLERVGFQVKLVPMDWNSLIDVYFFGANKNPTLDAINFSLSSIEPEQSIMKNGMTRYWPPNGLNWGYFSDPEVDKLGEESLAEFDVPKRNALIGKMYEKLVADAYEVFIVHDLNRGAIAETDRLRAGAKLVPGHDRHRRASLESMIAPSGIPRAAMPLFMTCMNCG